MDTTVDGLGIDSFVFSARRPFNDGRLMHLIESWPVSLKTTPFDLTDLRPGGSGAPPEEASPWEAVLRSKGNLWLSSRHHAKCLWTFAGRHFSLIESGEAWETLGEKATDEVEWGDRRTDLVVIGMDLDEATLRADLEACVLDDAEMDA